MKRLQRKIDVLNRTADRLLKSPDGYRWSIDTKCNCGQIVLSCGVNPRDMIDKFGYGINMWTGIWSKSIENVCELTRKPFKELFNILHINGFCPHDIQEVEYCENTEVLQRLGSLTRYVNCNSLYTKPVFVAFYFYSWADMLSEELEVKKAIKGSKHKIKLAREKGE